MSGTLYYHRHTTSAPISSPVDLFELTAAANKPVEFVRICLTHNDSYATTPNTQLVLELKRGNSSTTSGSGGSSTTIGSSTLDKFNTTKMSGGTITLLRSMVWNMASVFSLEFDIGARPIVLPGERLTLEVASMSDDANVGFSICVREPV